MQQPLPSLAGFEPPPCVTVRKDRTDSLQRRHPWVFVQQLLRPPANLPPGLTVELRDERGRFLGRGSYNVESRIAVRVVTFSETELLTAELLGARVAQALAARSQLAGDASTDAYRLVFAENDRLPGLIVDRYGDYLVLQCLSAGMSLWRDTLVQALAQACQPRGIYERSDGDDRRQHEGLEPAVGTVYGEDPPESLEIRQHGIRFAVDLRGGHKTGFYLDQRDNRQALQPYCAGAEVLNAFSYTGGFGLYAAAAGASRVVHVDSSGSALALCQANVALNPAACEHEYVDDNVFACLRRLRDEGRTFDVIVLDPPKFASSRANLEKAARGYKDLNLSALRLLRRGGILATFSCSGAMERALFYKTIADAATDAQREVQVLAELGQPIDHPVLLQFPEGTYLKGLIGRVV